MPAEELTKTEPVRTAVRFPLHLELVLFADQREYHAVTEDVSASGVLFAADELPPVNAEASFLLSARAGEGAEEVLPASTMRGPVLRLAGAFAAGEVADWAWGATGRAGLFVGAVVVGDAALAVAKAGRAAPIPGIWKRAMSFSRRPASSPSPWVAALVCSTIAAFCWVIWSIWLTAELTSPSAVLCSRLEVTIESM